MRRDLLIRLSALVGVHFLPGISGCSGNADNSARAPAPPPASPPAPPASTVTPDVQAAVTFARVPEAARLDSRVAGLSYEKTKLVVPLFTGTNTALIQLFGLLGPTVLRIGANAVDRSSWKGVEGGLTPILPPQIDALAAFVQATQCQVIYGVNLARNTPVNAASEAAYVATRLGTSLLAWEIGNEPDLYRRHGYRPSDWNYKDYLREWSDFRAAMRQVSPGVRFSGPDTSFDLKDYTVLFAHDEAGHFDLLTHHYYRADRNDPSSTLTLLLEPDSALQSELTRLVSAASDNGIPLGVRLTEANSFYNGGVPGASDAFGSALWVMDFMFTCALAGCTGVNLHGGDRGSYTPIADHDGAIVEARPLFYGMVMFAQAARGRPLRGMMTADATINASAWGVQRDDGGLNAILINKDDRRSIGMDLATGIAADRFEPLWLHGTALSATGVETLGGVIIGNEGSCVPQAQPPLRASAGQLSVVVPPAAALLVRSL